MRMRELTCNNDLINMGAGSDTADAHSEEVKSMAWATRPMWLEQEQLRWAWLAWEPLMMFRRVGMQFEDIEANAHWSEDWFRRLHGEEYIRKLAEAGFNCVTTHFHKGFGMVAEAEEMEMTRRLIKLCHRYGIRVLTYVQSMSLMYETFFAEAPEAKSWLQRDKDGRVPTYGDQYWRVFPCFSHDGYRIEEQDEFCRSRT